MIPLDQIKAKSFLAQNNLVDCEIKMVAGDASFRSYYRIFAGEKTFILMFAPPAHENIHPFIKIDKFLVEHDFSAPKIFAVDENEGFILLEDFGDNSYGRVLAGKGVGVGAVAGFADSANAGSTNSAPDISALEIPLYKNACDALIALHKTTPPGDLEVYNHALLFREVMLLVDWYLPHVKKITMTLEEKKRFKHLWFELFDALNRENPVLVLRDYHADNLMILQNRAGYKSVGLLDFQDAVIGSRAYDLVSLLEDARRDVSEKTREEIFAHYLYSTSIDKISFARDYAILSLQRNIKIIGIFARLATRDSKPAYLNLLPRVINSVIMRLTTKDPLFAEIAVFLQKFI